MWKVITLLVVLARLVPHPLGFTPVGAFGLFAGAHLKPRVSWLVPLVALAIGDFVTGLYDWRIMAFVYAGFLGGPLVGHLLLAKTVTVLRVAGGVSLGAVIFFLISNFGVWFVGYYPPTLEGLVQCYIMGLPFLGIALAGDSLYAGLLFGGYARLGNQIEDRLKLWQDKLSTG